MSRACHSYTPFRVPVAIYACLLWNVHTYKPAQNETQWMKNLREFAFVKKKMREKGKKKERMESLRGIPKSGDNEILIRSPID